jgi:RNA polymerase sigma-70 factor, ECF subfamily
MDSVPYTKDEELAFLRLARDGDMSAFEKLAEPYRMKAIGWATQRVGVDDAEDVVMQAMVKAWRSLPAFGGDARFSSWLYRIVQNCAMDHLRKRRSHRERILPMNEQDDRDITELADDQAPSPAAQTELSDLKGALQVALDQMDDDHRAVLLLHYGQGQSYKDIAATLDLHMGTVMSRLFNARKKLQRLLAAVEAGIRPAGKRPQATNSRDSQ